MHNASIMLLGAEFGTRGFTSPEVEENKERNTRVNDANSVGAILRWITVETRKAESMKKVVGFDWTPFEGISNIDSVWK